MLESVFTFPHREDALIYENSAKNPGSNHTDVHEFLIFGHPIRQYGSLKLLLVLICT